jgi:hypothetical protein
MHGRGKFFLSCFLLVFLYTKSEIEKGVIRGATGGVKNVVQRQKNSENVFKKLYASAE